MFLKQVLNVNADTTDTRLRRIRSSILCVIALLMGSCGMFLVKTLSYQYIPDTRAFRPRKQPVSPLCTNFAMVTPGRWNYKTFLPSFCRLPPPLSPEKTSKCLKRKGITRIGVLGDSQGWRYAKALSQGLPGPHRTARKEKPRSSFIPDVKYYNDRNISHVKVHSRDCSGCVSATSHHGPFTVDEVVSEYVMDSEVSLFDETRRDPRRAITTQQFTAKYWWSAPHTPHLVLYFSTISHDISQGSDHDYRRDLRWALDMWSHTLPQNTIFIVFNHHRINESLVPNKYAAVTKTSRMSLFNRVLREVVDSVSKGSSVVQRGPDLDDISRTIDPRARLYGDAVHFKETWYNVIVKNIFLPIFCVD